MLGQEGAHLLLAVALATAIALLARLFRMLTTSGAAAAFVVGVLVFGLGEWPHTAAMLAFFLSGSLLSRLPGGGKSVAEPGGRDAVQVLCNGGVPALLCIAYALSPEPRRITLLCLAALAAVNADTWATEIGARMGKRPRNLLDWKPVKPGASGAVSLVGLVASVLGALFVAAVGASAWPARSPELLWPPDSAEMLAVAWAGFMAALADSVLGAGLQARYVCAKCGETVEQPSHCGQLAVRTRGWAWMTNDVVNLACSALGVIFCWLLLRYWAYPL